MRTWGGAWEVMTSLRCGGGNNWGGKEAQKKGKVLQLGGWATTDNVERGKTLDGEEF